MSNRIYKKNNITKKIISIIVCTLNAKKTRKLMSNLKAYNSKKIELIVVNQSKFIIKNEYPKLIEINLNKPVGASKARNLGAKIATGKFLWFLDDDCEISFSSIDKIIDTLEHESKLDLLILSREYVNSKGTKFIYLKNLRGYIKNYRRVILNTTEWNFLINKIAFLKIKGFPLIGVGSNHRAQSGECFGIMCKLIKIRPIVFLESNAKVTHPSYSNRKEFNIVKSYHYGTGYVIGAIAPILGFNDLLFWSIRHIIGTLFFPIRKSDSTLMPINNKSDLKHFNEFKTKLILSRQRLLGYLNGLLDYYYKNQKSLDDEYK